MFPAASTTHRVLTITDVAVKTLTINVTSVNDAPAGTDNTVNAVEDTPYVFSASDFGFVDSNDNVANQLLAVSINSFPLYGVLTLDGVVVTQGQGISANDIAAGKLVFTPSANANGNAYISFKFRVQDNGGTANGGVDTDLDTRTLTINVTSVNDGPAGTSGTVTTLEDTPYVFTTSDFGFVDPSDDPANGLLAVKIFSLPGVGVLTLNGVAVIAGQNVSAEDIAAGKLVFAPAENANGTGYSSFEFQVQDDGGTANGGSDTDLDAKTLTINVTSVNDAPAGTSGTVTTLEDTPYVFTSSDFGFVDPSDDPANYLLAVTVSSLPDVGSLTNDGVAVAIGQSISAADIAAGKLVFTAVANANGAAYASFDFKVQDDGGIANGGVDTDLAFKTLTIAVTPVNDAPVASDTSVTLAEDTPTAIELVASASDIDGDAFSASIVSAPNYNGSDSFTYKVNDGQLDSNVSTVSLNVSPVNDAPVTVNGAAAMLDNQTLVIDFRNFGSDVDSALLTPVIVNGPVHGTLTANANGSYSYTPAIGSAGTETIRFELSDGQLLSNVSTYSISITQSNVAPVAHDSIVAGVEDVAYVFRWTDFAISDANSDVLSFNITNLPLDGQLQRKNAQGQWISVILGDRFAQPDLDAGNLRFVPTANASGGSMYGGTGTGNKKPHYASFGIQASDGRLSSNLATVNVDIAPVADAPILTVDPNASARELFRTGFEGVPNPDASSTLVAPSTLEGWNLITGTDCLPGGQNGFEVWSSGDQMSGALGLPHTVSAAAGNGQNWLELNDAGGSQAQTLGISRTVITEADALYTLSFDAAGRIGFGGANTGLAVYVDGVRVGGICPTSPLTDLDWETYSLQFIGKGRAQTIQIVTEASINDANGRGAQIDNIALDEYRSYNQGKEDTAISVSGFSGALTDTDGSERLKLTLEAIPVGSVITDGSNSFAASSGNTIADVTTWNLKELRFTPPLNYSGTVNLQAVATSQELDSTGHVLNTARTVQTIVVQVSAVVDYATLNLSERTDVSPLTRQLGRAGFEGVLNLTYGATEVLPLLGQEGWSLNSVTLGKLGAFEVWANGDRMTNANGTQTTVSTKAGDGSGFLRLNDGQGQLNQTPGVTLQLKATSTESSTGDQAVTIQNLTVNVISGTPVATPPSLNPYVTYPNGQSGITFGSAINIGTPDNNALIIVTDLKLGPVNASGNITISTGNGLGISDILTLTVDQLAGIEDRIRAGLIGWLN